MLFTKEELQIILQIANTCDVKGLAAMQAVLQIASKCQQGLQAQPAQEPPPATPDTDDLLDDSEE